MILKKLLSIFVIFCMILVPTFSLADDYLEEDTNWSDIAMEVSSDSSKIPTINARHAVVFDRASKTVLFGKNENETCKMASTTKIMTSLVVLENCKDLNAVVTISKKAAGTGGSRLGLSTNDKITVENLLYGLMMVSGNDAAVALAEFVGGSVDGFASMMNQKAVDLELNSTHFVTPHGLDQEEHYTTAFELAKITDYALKNDTFAKIVKTSNYTIFINSNPKTLHNTNELLGYLDGVYGVKTGFTNGANRCLVTSCMRGDLDIICVVLGCDTKKDRTLDSMELINYTFHNFSVVNLRDIIDANFENWYEQNSNSFKVVKGTSSHLDLCLNESQIPFERMAVNRSLVDKIDTSISFDRNYEAPLTENTVIGKMDVLIDDSCCFTIEIVNQNFVARKNVLFYLDCFLRNYFDYFLSS